MAVEYIKKGCRVLCAASVVAALFVIATSVVSYKMGRQELIRGGSEVVQMCQVMILSMAMVDMVRGKKEIRVGLVETFLSVRVYRKLLMMIYILEVGFGTVLCMELLNFAHHLWTLSEKGAASGIPIFPFVTVMALGFGLYTVIKITELRDVLSDRRN